MQTSLVSARRGPHSTRLSRGGRERPARPPCSVFDSPDCCALVLSSSTKTGTPFSPAPPLTTTGRVYTNNLKCCELVHAPLFLYLDQNYLSGIVKRKAAFSELEPTLRATVARGAVRGS